MNILVIGNGFDIEHKLPTEYKDFLDFMKGICIIETKEFMGNIKSFTMNLEIELVHEPSEIVKEFLCDEKFFDYSKLAEWENSPLGKELINCSNNNIWIKYFFENKDYIDKRWVDFEAEILKVIKCIDYSKKLSIYYKKHREVDSFDELDKDKNAIVEKIIEYSGLKFRLHDMMGNNFKNIIKRLNDDLTELIRCLEIYLCEYVEKIDITNNKSKYIQDSKYDGVLSFNYTNTFERLYAIKGDYADERILVNPYDYIHGKADLEKHKTKFENNMVLGIDEYLSEEEKNEKLDFIQFKKYFQRIFKKTGSEYIKWIEEMNGYYEDNEIVIFGHSLDVSDKDILRKLILDTSYQNQKNTKVIIYYHNEETYARQISNLVKIIGQDELIDRVYGEYPRIIFEKQD